MIAGSTHDRWYEESARRLSGACLPTVDWVYILTGLEVSLSEARLEELDRVLSLMSHCRLSSIGVDRFQGLVPSNQFRWYYAPPPSQLIVLVRGSRPNLNLKELDLQVRHEAQASSSVIALSHALIGKFMSVKDALGEGWRIADIRELLDECASQGAALSNDSSIEAALGLVKESLGRVGRSLTVKDEKALAIASDSVLEMVDEVKSEDRSGDG